MCRHSCHLQDKEVNIETLEEVKETRHLVEVYLLTYISLFVYTCFPRLQQWILCLTIVGHVASVSS